MSTLINQIIDQLNVSRQQAEGGVGLLLQQAQKRLSSEDFQRVADAIPAISDLIGKAPRQVEPEGPLQELWQRWFRGWGPLASSRSRYKGLELDRAEINKFITVISSHFRERGGVELESLLSGAWR